MMLEAIQYSAGDRDGGGGGGGGGVSLGPRLSPGEGKERVWQHLLEKLSTSVTSSCM